MKQQLLSDLLDNIHRLNYTIDDCFANPKILGWQPFLDELQEELQALQNLFPKVKTPLQLIQKYYTKYIDLAAILEQADKDIDGLKAQIQSLHEQDQSLQNQLQNLQNTQKETLANIQQTQKELQKYKQLNQELVHEQSVLSPLTDKTKYKKIYKEIEQQAAQYNIGILECENTIAQLQNQLETLAKDSDAVNANRQNIADQTLQLQQKINDTLAHKQQAQQQPDYQEETQALQSLEAFFNQKSPALNPIHLDILPKNWRNILDSLLKSRLPSPKGWLQTIDGSPQLVFGPVAHYQIPLAAALAALRHSLNQNLDIQFDDCAFLPVGPNAQARITFREKGRVVASLSQSNPDADSDFDADDIPSQTIDLFLRNDHQQTTKTHPNTVTDLYILFKNYVIDISFYPNI